MHRKNSGVVPDSRVVGPGSKLGRVTIISRQVSLLFDLENSNFVLTCMIYFGWFGSTFRVSRGYNDPHRV
jgi:hypothetical protein